MCWNAAKNRDDFIPAVEVQLHVIDGRTIHPLLPIQRFPHRTCSSKIVAWLLVIPVYSDDAGHDNVHVFEDIFQESPEKTGIEPFEGRTLAIFAS